MNLMGLFDVISDWITTEWCEFLQHSKANSNYFQHENKNHSERSTKRKRNTLRNSKLKL